MTLAELQSLFSEPWNALSVPSKTLLGYGLMMLAAMGVTSIYSMTDDRSIREVGVWVKPLKFMAATALFAATTVWAIKIANSDVDQMPVFIYITSLILLTSFFEVAYISYQASKAEPSHYNNSNAFHAVMFMLMGIAAVGLVASQAWLAWEIWKEQSPQGLSTVSLSVIIGLTLTCFLSIVSGFLLGGHQPPPGAGLPLVGWHLHKDNRPAHFLGVHAQQMIPLLGLAADKFLSPYGTTLVATGSVLYTLLWAVMTWLSL
jgi:hypothetical protein